MKQWTIVTLVGLTVLAAATPARADHVFDYNKDCFAKQGSGGNVDFERNPIVWWDCFDYSKLKGTAEYSQFAKNCDQTNEALGVTSLVCKIDHKSFDDFFKLEAKKKVKDRNDTFTPLECAHALGLFMGNNAGSPPVTATIKRHAKITAEFLAKVSTLSCMFDAKDRNTVSLDGKTLTFHIAPGDQDNGYIDKAMRRLFPAYNKAWESEH